MQYTTPGVYYEAVDRNDQRPIALRTDVAGFVGVAGMGPLNQPVRVSSWRQFESTFGGLHYAAFLGYAVRGFFENGGRECHVVRVAAPARETYLLTGWDQPADGACSVVEPRAGFVPGAVVTVSQAFETQRKVAAIDPAARRIVWDTALDSGLWLDRPILFKTGEGLASLSPEGRTQPSDRLSSLLRSIGGFKVGDEVSIEQTRATRSQPRRIGSIGGAGSQLFWEQSLLPAFDLAQPLALETGANAAGQDYANLRGEFALHVEAASPGAWGNSLYVRLETSAGSATVSTPGVQPPDRGSSIAGDVSGFQRGDLVRIFQTAAATPIAYKLVAGVDAVRRKIIWLDHANGVPELPWSGPLPATFDLNRPLHFERVDLAISVQCAGAVRQVFARLSLLPGHPRYAPDLLAQDASALVKARPLETTQLGPQDLAMMVGGCFLTGGRDGLAALTPADMIGSEGTQSLPSSDGDATNLIDMPRGLGALARVDEVAILAAPDAHLRPTPLPEHLAPPPPVANCAPCEAPEITAPLPPPEPLEPAPYFDEDGTFQIQSALVEQAERLRERFAVLEPLLPLTLVSMQGAVTAARAWRRRFETKFAALYFPWVQLRDPLHGGSLRSVPPGGHVAGTYAHFDLEEGVHRPPANIALRWLQTLTAAVDEPTHGLLNEEGINVIRAFTGRGIRVYGARTMSTDAYWRYINVRRLFSMIEEAIEEGLQWSVFEPNNYALRELLRLGISELLESIWRTGALAGETPEEAFFVRCDEVNNTPYLGDVGQVVVDVGIAPAVPGEFIVVRVGRTRDEIQIDELGSSALLPANAGRA